MKMGHLELVSMLLAAMMLLGAFQVKAGTLDMAANAFDDEYLKCADRMETKYVPQLLEEEKATHQLLGTVWQSAERQWEARKAGIFLPVNFKDNHGIALMAFVAEAREQTPFYHLFNKAVGMAGRSRKDYIYAFQFKAFHFYLARALQLLRRPCEDSYRGAVYSAGQAISLASGGLHRARLGNFTLASATRPQAAGGQQVLTIHSCFGVAVERFFDKESDRIAVIPLSEIFQVSQEGAGNDLVLRSTNKTCSHYECAFLGGLKTENCVENLDQIQPIYIYNPGEENQKLEDSGVKSLEVTQVPGIKLVQPDENPSQPDEKPAPVPGPVPGPKTHPSASSGHRLLPALGVLAILTSASAVDLCCSVA